MNPKWLVLNFLLLFGFGACQTKNQNSELLSMETFEVPKLRLIETDTFHFNNFVEGNMAEVWIGDKLYISFNPNRDLGEGANSQAWTKPQLLVEKPGHVLWYPSLQPLNTDEDVEKKYTSLRLGKKARLFFKFSDLGKYMSLYEVEFEK